MNVKKIILSLVAVSCSLLMMAQETDAPSKSVKTQEEFQKELKEFREKTQAHMLKKKKASNMTFTFDGDSIAQLDKEQCTILDHALDVFMKNDSVAYLPQELNLLIGDTTDVNYLAYPDWYVSFFIKRPEVTKLVIPMFAMTPNGVVKSEAHISLYKGGGYQEEVYSFISENGEDEKGTYLCSSMKGVLFYGRLYKDGKFLCRINGTRKPKATRPNNSYKRNTYTPNNVYNRIRESSYPIERKHYDITRSGRSRQDGERDRARFEQYRR